MQTFTGAFEEGAKGDLLKISPMAAGRAHPKVLLHGAARSTHRAQNFTLLQSACIRLPVHVQAMHQQGHTGWGSMEVGGGAQARIHVSKPHACPKGALLMPNRQRTHVFALTPIPTSHCHAGAICSFTSDRQELAFFCLSMMDSPVNHALMLNACAYAWDCTHPLSTPFPRGKKRRGSYSITGPECNDEICCHLHNSING